MQEATETQRSTQNGGTGGCRRVRAALAAGLWLGLIGCMTLPAYRRPAGYSSTYHKHLKESPPLFFMDEAVVEPADSAAGTHQHHEHHDHEYHDHRHHGHRSHGHHDHGSHGSSYRRRPRPRMTVGAPPRVKRRDGHFR